MKHSASSSDIRPLVSVITVVRNAASSIEATLQSVVALKDSRLHYVVLDGGSTDGTIDIIARYAEHIDYWHSRPDGGIYEAMNEALTYATGRYILNMNAGDTLSLIPYETLERSADNESIAAVCASVLTEHGQLIAPNSSLCALHYYNTLPHQGLFYKREVLATYPYDTHYRVFADFALNQRLFLLEGKCFVTDEAVVAVHALDGVSNQKVVAHEFFAIIRQHFGSLTLALAWLRCKYLGLRSRLKL